MSNPSSDASGAKPPMRERLAPKPDPVQHPPSSSQLLNIPNALTGLRIVLVIPFAILLFGYGGSQWARSVAAIIFAIASVTDFLDGAIARKMDLVTTFGKIADPIADKALTGVALIGLSYHNELAWWITIVILGREIGVTLLRFWVIKHGVIAASRGGKLKTVFQILAIFMYLLPLTGVWVTVSMVAMGITVALALVTGVDYLVRAINLRNRQQPARA